MRRIYHRAIASVSLSLSIFGCGYTLQGSKTVLPPDVRTIQIPTVDNDSAEPGLARILTEALRDRFERFGTVTVVDTTDEADAILTARIKSIDRDTQTSTSKTDTALQLRVKMILAADLRRVSGEVLWKDPSITVFKVSAADSGVVVTSSPGFVGGGLSAGDLGNLNSREVARLEGEQALAAISDSAADTIYNAAVAPDF